MANESVLNGVHRERTPTQKHPQFQVHSPHDTSRRSRSAAQLVQFPPSTSPAIQTQTNAPQDVSGISAVHPNAHRGSNLPSSSIGSPLQHYPPSAYNNYQGPYTISHPSSFPSTPPQAYPYTHPHGYAPHLPLESGQYLQNPLGFRPMMQSHTPLEAGRQFPLPDNSGMYPTAHGPLAHSPLPPPVTSGSHSTPYTNQQYQPPRYPSTGTPHHYNHAYQPNPYHWYYGPPVPHGFTKGIPMYYQPHFFPPQQQALPPDLEPRFSRVSTVPGGPTSPEQPIAPPTAPSAMRPSQVSTPASVSPATSSRLERHGPTPSPVNVSSLSHSERPLVRRPYHPDPPTHRSEWVMWVGNVPDDTTHDEVWKFLTRPSSVSEPPESVDNGVLSIFLISRSNCAFVNYNTEESLQLAIARFHGKQLHPHELRCPRLVCRARRKEDDLRAGVGGQRGMGVHTRYVKEQREMEKQEEAPSEDDRDSSLPSQSGRPPTLPPLPSDEDATKVGPSLRPGPCARAQSGSSYSSSTNSSFLSRYFPKRFFILKSLTQVRIL